MILEFDYNGLRVKYIQPELPWYKRWIGMEYGPRWQIILCSDTRTYPSGIYSTSPTPAKVMKAVLRLYDQYRSIEVVSS